MPLERQVEVDLHLRQTRSPAQELGNGSRQRRHLRIFCSALRRASRSASHSSAQPSPHASWQSAKAPCSFRLLNSSSTMFATGSRYDRRLNAGDPGVSSKKVEISWMRGRLRHERRATSTLISEGYIGSPEQFFKGNLGDAR
jgi:hypothetical protein